MKNSKKFRFYYIILSTLHIWITGREGENILVLRNVIAFHKIIITPGLKVLTAKRACVISKRARARWGLRGWGTHHFYILSRAREIPVSKNERQDELWRYVKYRATRTAVVKRRYRAADMRVHLSISGRAHLSVYRCACATASKWQRRCLCRQIGALRFVVRTDKNTPTKFCPDRKCAEIATAKPANYLCGALRGDNNIG